MFINRKLCAVIFACTFPVRVRLKALKVSKNNIQPLLMAPFRMSETIKSIIHISPTIQPEIQRKNVCMCVHTPSANHGTWGKLCTYENSKHFFIVLYVYM